MTTATAQKPATEQKPVARTDQELERIVEYKPFACDDFIKLSANIVIRYLCKPTKNGAKCTVEQAVKFIMLCQARKLNPFEGDAFLVGYDTKDGPEFNLITAHQAFIKRAEAHLQYDGMESGVIVQRGADTIELPGDFFNGKDELVGGWAKVFRKDRTRPTYRRVKLGSYQKPFGVWNQNPATMICKVAEADALRSTFPNNLAGLYIDGELPEAEQERRERRGIDYRPTAPAVTNGNGKSVSIVVNGESREPVILPPVDADDDADEKRQPPHPTAFQFHAKQIEEAETGGDVDKAYAAAFDDENVTKSERAKLANVKEERLKELKGTGSGSMFSDEQERHQATK